MKKPAAGWMPIFAGRSGFYAAPVRGNNPFPPGRVGALADHPIWADNDLRRNCRGNCPAAGAFRHVGAGSGRRSGAQPNFADHPLPPRGGHRRKSDGLCGRHREEGQAAGAGAYGYARVIRALTGDGGISQPHDPQPDASRKPGAESICFSPRLFRLWIRRVVKRIIEMFIPLRP